MRRKLLSALLALCVASTLLVPVSAEPGMPEEPDENETMFALYVAQQFLGGLDIELYGNYGENKLSGLNLEIYQALKTEIEKIAKSGGSTEIKIGTFTGSTGELPEDINTQEKFNAFVNEKLAGLDQHEILDCLLVDCPYELFWFDKTGKSNADAGDSNKKHAMDMEYSAGAEEGRYFIALNFTFTVVPAYRSAVDQPYSVTSTLSAIQTAAANAKKIVEANSGKSDYEKLLAYKEEICKLASYNDAASKEDWTGGYGDPWQLIWVFDQNDETEVVCEGYAKAFQYLCDMSEFEDAQCYTVTGTTNAGNGAGDHMWNIVTLGGQNYLVDVTNSDAGAIGKNGELFMAGTAPIDTNKNSYKFSIDASNHITYTYGQDQVAMYGEILNLAAAPYTAPSIKITPYVAGVPTATAVTYGDKLSASNLTGGTVQVSDQVSTAVDGSWSWVDPGQSVGDAGTHNFKARFTPTDGDSYNAVDYNVTVTVNKAKIDISGVHWQEKTTFSYDGLTHSVILTGVPKEVEDVYNGSNAKYVGTYTAHVTLTPADKTNYELEGTMPADQSWSITAVNQSVSIKNESLRKGGNTLVLSTLVNGNKGELTFTLTNDGGTGSTLSGKTLTSGTTEGTVTIGVTAAAKDENDDGTSEYNAFSGTLAVTIVDKKTASLTVTQSGTTYGSTLADPVYTKPNGAGEATVTYIGTTRAGVSYPSSAEKPTEAGSYTVTVRCETSDTVHTGSDSFTIAPRDIRDAAIVLDSTELVYDKTEQTKTVASVTVGGKALAGGDYTVSGSKGTNAGEYTLTVTAKDNTNYTGSATMKFTIAPKPVSVAAAVAANRIYDGSRDVSVMVTFDDSDIPVQTVTGKMSDADVGTGKPVAVTVTLNDANYTLDAQPAGVTVTISKAAARVLKDIELSHRYSAEGTGSRDLSGLVTGSNGYTLGTVQDEDGIIKDLAVSPAGMLTYTRIPQGSFVSGTKATITVTIASKNYEDSTVKVIISLTDKLIQAPLTLTTTGPATYGQPLNLSASGGSGTGAVTFSVTNETGSATIAGNVLTPTQAGTVAVIAIKAADEEYEEVHSDFVTITINKGTPVVRPTYTAITSNGKTLADANLGLPIGMTPAGTIAWDMISTTSVTANTWYNWTFTPTDTVNWNTVTGNIVLWSYRPSRPGGSGSTGIGTVSGESTGSASSRPSSSSGGSATASTGSSSVSSGVSSTTARPDVTIINGTTSAALTTSMGQRLVEAAVRNSSGTVIIAPKMDQSTTSAAVSIPSDIVRDLSSSTKADLRVNSPVANITIPNGALAELASGSSVTVSTALRDGVVSVDIASNGSNVKRVSGGVTVQIPASSCTYSTVAMLVNADGSAQVIRKSIPDPTQGVVSIPLDGSAQVIISTNSQSFSDVPANSWAANAVAFISSHEIMNGTSEGTFSPDAPMTRGMLAAVLHNIEGNPNSSGLTSFSDVGSSWYADAVQWAASQGIVSGYSDGRFGPDDMVTREQLAVMLYRYAGQPPVSISALSFADADQVSNWSKEAIQWAVDAGILSGDGSRLNPGGQATRAEAASILMRFLTNS